MGLTGRPPKPTEVKRLLGNPGGRSLPKTSIVIPMVTDIPRPPRALGKLGRAAWKRLWTAGAGWLSPTTDVDILTRLCEAHDERAILRQTIDDEGRILQGEKGQYVHPAVWLLQKVDGTLTRYEQLCGFTPSDRSRLGLAEVKRVSKLDEFLRTQAG